MKSAALILVALLAGPAAAAESASPINKVMEMIGGLQAKIIKEGEESQKVYDEFAEWCEDRSKDLTFEIKTGKSTVTSLEATIEEESSTIASLETEIDKLAGDIKTDEADLKAATEIREKESAAFASEEKEMMDIVDTLQRAIGILEKEMKKGGASMMQLKNAGSLVQALSVMMDSSMINTADATKLTAFVQNQQEDSDSGAPAAAVYENQSGGILEVLGDMLDKAETQLESARQTETKSLHAYEMVKQSLTDEIKFGNKEMGEAKAGTAAASEKKAGAEGDLEMTNKDLSEDIKAKSELHHECMTKATDFEAEVKSRGEELAALAKAKQIINEAMASALDQQSAGLDEATSFLQMSTGTSAQVQAVHLIRELAKKHHNPMLAQLAARIVSVGRGRTSASDVFAKVKDLIRDMVEKLEAEAEADATQKAFCDKELGETNTKKDQKETEIEKLQTKIDSDSARSAELKDRKSVV